MNRRYTINSQMNKKQKNTLQSQKDALPKVIYWFPGHVSHGTLTIHSQAQCLLLS